MISYDDFLETKRIVFPNVGIEVPEDRINPHLFPFQKALVRYSLRKGRSACWASTGLGKTRISLAWAEHAAERVLLLCPLAVAQQTVREGAKIGIPVTYARHQDQAARFGITATNYEMMDAFDADAFGAVVLDESSILKSFDGKTRTRLIEKFRRTPYKCCLTATPAPNDQEELSSHAEFLGIMPRQEFLACWFIHDDEGWRLKRHGRDAFYRWLASWAMTMKKPSDIGFDDTGYDLPPLSIVPHFMETDYAPSGKLFAEQLNGVTERASVRRQTFAARTAAAVALMEAEHREPWIAWCGLNDEADRIASMMEGAVNVEGSQTPDQKVDGIGRFLDGRARVLVTKPSVAGHGLNLQHCRRMVFVGLGDSWEQYYQCIRRCWRFGQTEPVTVHIVLTEPERCIWENVQRKDQEAEQMSSELVKHVAQFEKLELAQPDRKHHYTAGREMTLPSWIKERQ